MPIKDFSYPTPAYQGLVLEQSKYNIDPYNFELLGKALDKQEARHNAAIQQKSKVDEALGKIRERLYEHPENMQWFDAYNQNIENSISELVATGDYAGALAEATRIGGEAAKDKEVIARVKYSDELKEHEKYIQGLLDKGVIDEDYYNYDKKHNGWNFEYEYEKDEQGNKTDKIIGYKPYKVKEHINGMPDYATWIQQMFKAITPSTGGSTGNKKLKLNPDGTPYTIVTNGKPYYQFIDSSTQKTFDVSEEQINKNVKWLFDNQPGINNQVRLDFKVKFEALKNKEIELEHETVPEKKKVLGIEVNMLKQQFRCGEFKIQDGKRVWVEDRLSDDETTNMYLSYMKNKMWSEYAKNMAQKNVVSHYSESLTGGGGSSSGGSGTSSEEGDFPTYSVEGQEGETEQ